MRKIELMNKMTMMMAAIAALVQAALGGDASLWKNAKAMWETPKTYPVASMEKPGVKAMAV